MGEVDRDHAGLAILDDAACDRLLRDQAIGRIGIVIDGDPLILPVNYAWVDGVVLVRSGAGSKLTAAARRHARRSRSTARTRSTTGAGRCWWSAR
jgi:uncharacterized protein